MSKPAVSFPVSKKTGEQLECWGCGSKDHLLRQCPNVQASASGKGKGGGKRGKGGRFTALTTPAAVAKASSSASSSSALGGLLAAAPRATNQDWVTMEIVGVSKPPEQQQHWWMTAELDQPEAEPRS